MDLDQTDVRILHHLEGNGRITNHELAEAVGLSASACFRRVKLLEERGVIAGYRCVLGAKQVGVAFEALVNVSMRSDIENWHENFVQSIHRWPEVVTARIVTGTSNYVLTVRTKDLEHFSHFVIHKLHKEPGVMAINSNIVLETLKMHGSVLDLLE
jgi:DNA-binding Lrp family transcriptional regulator